MGASILRVVYSILVRELFVDAIIKNEWTAFDISVLNNNNRDLFYVIALFPHQHPANQAMMMDTRNAFREENRCTLK
jgi:hypothetical protein